MSFVGLKTFRERFPKQFIRIFPILRTPGRENGVRIK